MGNHAHCPNPGQIQHSLSNSNYFSIEILGLNEAETSPELKKLASARKTFLVQLIYTKNVLLKSAKIGAEGINLYSLLKILYTLQSAQITFTSIFIS